MKKYLLLLIVTMSTWLNMYGQSNLLSLDIKMDLISENEVRIKFNQAVNTDEASNPANYVFKGSAGIHGNPLKAAVLDNEVTLELPRNIKDSKANELIEVVVSNITSSTGNTLDETRNIAKYFIHHFYENVRKGNLSTSYSTQSYVGNHSIEWEYAHCRDLPTANGDGLMLRFSKTDKRSFISSVDFKNGINSLSFNYYKDWSNADPRIIEVTINDEKESINFDVEAGLIAPIKYKKDNLKLAEVSNIRIENSSASNQNIVINNIHWTSYAPTSINSLEFISGNEILVEFNQLIDENDVIEDNFELSFDDEVQTILSVDYSQGNFVIMKFETDINTLEHNTSVKVIANSISNPVNDLLCKNEEKSININKPQVNPKLEYVDFSTVKLHFSTPVNSSDALNTENYELGGTGGATGAPVNATMEDESTVVLTIPSMEDYEDGQNIEIAVSNVRAINNIFWMDPNNNTASLTIDRTAPEVLTDLEFVDMETVIVRFSESVKVSDQLNDYIIGGTCEIVGSPIAVSIIDEATIELKLASISDNFSDGKTLTITVDKAYDDAGNSINSEANIATYLMDESLPVLSIAGINEILHRSANVDLEFDKAGELYWSLFDDISKIAVHDSILEQKGILNGKIIIEYNHTESEVKIEDLIWNSDYKFACCMISREGALSQISEANFKTQGPEEVFADEELGEYKTCSVFHKSGRIVVQQNTEISVDNTQKTIRVYDIKGQLKAVEKMTGNTHTMPYLPPGIYLVIISGADGSEVTKIHI